MTRITRNFLYLCTRYADYYQGNKYCIGHCGGRTIGRLHCQCDGRKLREDMNNKTLTIRVGKNTLSFSMIDNANGQQPIVYEPYVVKSGISMAANLREAFKTSDLLAEEHRRARVMVDSKVLMVPVEQFQEGNASTLYHHSFPKSEQQSIVYNVLPDLNAVAIFSVNKDLMTVINDHYADVRPIHLMAPVWRYLHQRSFTGHRSKLYGYFHDRQLDIFSFQQHRFKFCNAFDPAVPTTHSISCSTYGSSSTCNPSTTRCTSWATSPTVTGSRRSYASISRRHTSLIPPQSSTVLRPHRYKACPST